MLLDPNFKYISNGSDRSDPITEEYIRNIGGADYGVYDELHFSAGRHTLRVIRCPLRDYHDRDKNALVFLLDDKPIGLEFRIKKIDRLIDFYIKHTFAFDLLVSFICAQTYHNPRGD